MLNLDEKVNELAIRYSVTGDETALEELLTLLKGVITSRAYAFARTTNTSVDEYISLLTEAVWLSIRDGKLANHDTSRTNVMARFHTYWTRVYHKRARDEKYACRAANSDAVSLNTKIVHGDSTVELVDTLTDETRDDIGNEVALKDAMERFERINPEGYRVMEAVINGEDTTTIAGIMGYEEYNATARKKLMRIKHQFHEHVFL